MTLCLGMLAAMAAHTLAGLLEAPRPFVLGLSPNYISHGARGSLPSAHASVLFTWAGVLLLRPSLRSRGWVMAGIAAVTGWGRIYAGAHFPLDVLGGALLAACMTGSFAVVQQAATMKSSVVHRAVRRLHAVVT